MYGFFYPENNDRFLASMTFATAKEAIDYFRDKRGTWQETKPSGQDEAAFLDPRTGAIVVVRQVAA